MRALDAILAVTLLAAGSLVGCTPSGERCLRHSDCDATKVCLLGQCQVPVSSDANAMTGTQAAPSTSTNPEGPTGSAASTQTGEPTGAPSVAPPSATQPPTGLAGG